MLIIGVNKREIESLGQKQYIWRENGQEVSKTNEKCQREPWVSGKLHVRTIIIHRYMIVKKTKKLILKAEKKERLPSKKLQLDWYLNRSISIEEIKSIIKNLPMKETPDPDSFPD